MKFSVQKKSNNKQQFQISFGIPPVITRLVENTTYQWRKFSFWLNPFHCDVCGKRQYVQRPQYEHVFENGRRLVVENTASYKVGNSYKSRCVCRDCLVDQLEKGEWKPRFSHFHEEREGKPSRYNYRFWSEKRCAITDKKIRSYKDVEVYPYVDMLFCTMAWNHDYISKEAVIECVRYGKVRTSMWSVYRNKKMMQLNSKRLFIDDEGELV